ncbi:pyridoxal 4-dehydrogenase [Alsobacter soli]|uniref:Pyridoxal 4-dehydrogenase n=1 Tax=Alsobacter soli TaxID=2109933 RepID=A0A2T1HWW7_9HYPH|nr:aldo/keto reductase [Alsobacter soli]PSC06183.1 pyridoxal 4-dehydrogenase [Alsobacter soli]
MQTRSFITPHGARLDVSLMGFGAAPLGDLYERLDEREALATLEAAHDAGVTLFDASPHYGNGLAEVRCGAVLRRFPRDSVVFSTKVGRVMDPFSAVEKPRDDVISPGFAGGFPHRARFDYSYDGTMRSVEQSLLRTGFDRIDILLIHDVDVWTHGSDFERRFGEAMGGAYRALDELRRTGFCKAIGVGINEADVSARFLREGDFDVTLLAGRYSLLEQPALEEFLPLAVQKKVGVMLGGVFNSGILATGAAPGAKFNYAPAPADILERVRRIEAVCARHGVPLRQAALAFAAAHPAVISVVIGAVKPGEIRANAADVNAAIPPALWSELKGEGLLAQDAPTP